MKTSDLELPVGTLVEVLGIGPGTVRKVRLDSDNDPIYTVVLNDATATPDGLYYARNCELAVRAE